MPQLKKVYQMLHPVGLLTIVLVDGSLGGLRLVEGDEPRVLLDLHAHVDDLAPRRRNEGPPDDNQGWE